MRRLFYLTAAVVWAALSASAFGQGTGGMGGSGAGGGTGLSGGSGGGGFGGGTGGTGTSGTGILGTSGGMGTLGTTANRTTGGGRTTAGSFAPAQSNVFGGTYGNPLYNGRPGSTNLSLTTPGGFGTATYGTITSTTGGQGTQGGRNAGGRATINSGLTGGTGGTTGQNGSTTVVTHLAELKFPVAPVVPSALQADLQGQLNRSSMWKAPPSITVEVIDGLVVLRGRVADSDDRRMAEAMVRLTPGVREVRNELTSP
jgi:hypothetical protein